LGQAFEVLPANIEEPSHFNDPQQFVKSVSWLKARAIAPKIEEGIILAADTIGWLDGGAILKPEDEADARRILTKMGGRDHELWTGVTLWRRPDDLQILWQERSIVRMRAMSEDELTTYLATRSWKDHSGAYAIEEQGDPYVTIVQGSITNVIGLPLETLAERLPLLYAK
jgi:septum formation protein